MRLTMGLVVAAVLAVGVAGCGDDAESKSDSNATAATGGNASGKCSKPEKFVISSQRTSSLIPVQLAEDAGEFKRNCVVNKYEPTPGPAQAIAQVLSGRAAIAFVAAPSTYQLTQKGVKLKVVASNIWAAKTLQIAVPNDSSIKDYKDIEGRSFALPVLGGAVHTATLKRLDELNVPAKSVKFTVLPFAAIADTIASGRVDVGQMVEPFVALTKGKVRIIDDEPLKALSEDPTAVSFIVTSEKYYKENTDLVNRWRDAYLKGIDKTKNPEAARAAFAKIAKVPPAAAKIVNLPLMQRDSGVDSFLGQIEAGKKYGLIKPGVSEQQLRGLFLK